MDDAVIRWRLSASPRDCTRAFVRVRIGKKSFFPLGKKGSNGQGGTAGRYGTGADRAGHCWTLLERISGFICSAFATVSRRDRREIEFRSRSQLSREWCTIVVFVATRSRGRIGQGCLSPGPKISRTSTQTSLRLAQRRTLAVRAQRIIYEITGDYGKRDSDTKWLVPKTDYHVSRSTYTLPLRR